MRKNLKIIISAGDEKSFANINKNKIKKMRKKSDNNRKKSKRSDID